MIEKHSSSGFYIYFLYSLVGCEIHPLPSAFVNDKEGDVNFTQEH